MSRTVARHICNLLELPEDEKDIIINELEMLKAIVTLKIKYRELEKKEKGKSDD